jgi:hypothetical protein
VSLSYYYRSDECPLVMTEVWMFLVITVEVMNVHKFVW